MDPKAFQNTTSGRVIRVGQGQAAYWAFVPNPLPPRLAIDWELASLNARMEKTIWGAIFYQKSMQSEAGSKLYFLPEMYNLRYNICTNVNIT